MSPRLAREPAAYAAGVAAAAAEVWATRSLVGSCATAAGCVAVAALLVCRRWPRAALMVTLPAVTLGYMWLAPMLALYQVALRAGPLTTLAAAASVAVASFAPWGELESMNWTLSSVALAALFSGLTATVPVLVARLVSSRRELRARMAELARARTSEQALETQRRILRERVRLSRDIHDMVAHHLSLIALQTSALEVNVPPDRRPTVALVRKSSQEALSDLRRLVTMLRMPADGSEGVPTQGFADLPALVAMAGPHVTADLSGLRGAPCPLPVQEAVFRLVQESLTNARKHAPGAPVSVVVRQEDSNLLVEVRNEGGGGKPVTSDSDGKGIQGMRERSEALGGTLLARPLTEGGFMVRARLPLPDPAVRA